MGRDYRGVIEQFSDAEAGLIGPVMAGIDGLALSADERELLRHPTMGGVILFARNYESPEQLRALTVSIRRLRPALLIAVDHEGGRVQRFREGFTRLPPLATWGGLHQRDADQALAMARAHGRLIGYELGAVAIDFSFAPVADLAIGNTSTIGDRAFDPQPEVVCELACALTAGLAEAGMAAVGKHFPGHGFVAEDSHEQLPVDRRSFDELAANDLRPFAALIAASVHGLLPGWVIYPAVDNVPACFSRKWLTGILRNEMGFGGAIFSDDLGMGAAAFAGGPLQRAQTALDAGCDMVLACNDRGATEAIIDGLDQRIIHRPDSLHRLRAMRYNRPRPGVPDQDSTAQQLLPYLLC